MDANETPKKTPLIQAWEDWDEAEKPTQDETKLCRIDNPDCEACQ